MIEQLTQGQIEFYFKILDNKESYEKIEAFAKELMKSDNVQLHTTDGGCKIILNPYWDGAGEKGLYEYFHLELEWGEVTDFKQWEIYLKCFIDAFTMLLENGMFKNDN